MRQPVQPAGTQLNASATGMRRATNSLNITLIATGCVDPDRRIEVDQTSIIQGKIIMDRTPTRSRRLGPCP